MSNADNEEMEGIFGPLYKFSDHKIGEMIRFKLRGKPVTGEIAWITGPGPSPSGKRHVPITYVCFLEGELTPSLVYQSEVLEK